jgi:anti-sigma B factor antagonist
LGENVLGGADALNFSTLLEDIGKQGALFAIINLEHVVMMNSSGLGMLVSGLTVLRKYGAKMFLCNLPPKVESLLAMTHLNQVFTTFTDIKEALNNCK